MPVLWGVYSQCEWSRVEQKTQRAAGVERRRHARLGDRDGPPLHRLADGDPVGRPRPSSASRAGDEALRATAGEIATRTESGPTGEAARDPPGRRLLVDRRDAPVRPHRAPPLRSGLPPGVPDRAGREPRRAAPLAGRFRMSAFSRERRISEVL